MRPRRSRNAWFRHLLWHPASRRSGSILSPGTHSCPDQSTLTFTHAVSNKPYKRKISRLWKKAVLWAGKQQPLPLVVLETFRMQAILHQHQPRWLPVSDASSLAPTKQVTKPSIKQDFLFNQWWTTDVLAFFTSTLSCRSRHLRFIAQTKHATQIHCFCLCNLDF